MSAEIGWLSGNRRCEMAEKMRWPVRGVERKPPTRFCIATKRWDGRKFCKASKRGYARPELRAPKSSDAAVRRLIRTPPYITPAQDADIFYAANVLADASASQPITTLRKQKANKQQMSGAIVLRTFQFCLATSRFWIATFPRLPKPTTRVMVTFQLRIKRLAHSWHNKCRT